MVKINGFYLSKYWKTYFRIRSGYTSEGWSSPEASAAFHQESCRLFAEGGWTVEIGDRIPSYERAKQDDGSVCFYFGNTCIKAREIESDGRLKLLPTGGDQTACGEWVELEPDVVDGYCTLLTRQINAKRARSEQ